MASYMEDLGIIASSLRKKLLLFMLVFFAAFMTAFQLAGSLIATIKEDLLPEGAKLVYVSPLEVMLLKMKIAVIIGIFVMLPMVLFFAVRPLLKKSKIPITVNKKWVFVSFILAIIAFLAGASYAYFIMLPLFINYLFLNASASGVVATYSIFSFISFAVQASLIFGLVFETPLVLTILTRLNVVQYSTLIKYRKHIYVLCLVVGAVITPPDVISQLMVGIPLLFFFELSLIIVRFAGGKKKESKAE
ncbi:twin-arginine translocase subunit TatC [Methanolobus sp. ZRKC3]|uniref:twin-arginine translocase subunit TatC n=1 Tax=Methanolobus sp. ZRKC3 TaxID=3125786 RepID=UPI003253AB86